jgi:AAA+ ATPase superfamily predicted ATPase
MELVQQLEESIQGLEPINKSFIDCEKLEKLIQNKRKVLIIAPRRTGKTWFIERSIKTDDIVIVLYSKQKSNFIDNVQRLKKFKPSVFQSNNDENFRFIYHTCGRVFVDDVFWMPDDIQNMIKNQLNLSSQIILISCEHPDNYQEKINCFKENGFEIINVPLSK